MTMPQVKTAGIIGRFFHIDPMKILESNHFDFAVRAAAYRYAALKEKAAREAAAKQQKR